MNAADDELAALLVAASVPASLQQVFKDEELDAKLLRSMASANLLTNLRELGLSAAQAGALTRLLHEPIRPRSPARPDPTKAPADQNPMVICADHGLCNRLRAVLSYSEVARRQGRNLLVVWQRDNQCNGEFLDCFAPLPGVRFVREPPPWAPAPERANHTHCDVKGTEAEAGGFALLRPAPALQKVLEASLRECAPSFVAVHIRRTDMSVWAAIQPDSRYAIDTADERFDGFLDAHGQHNLYCATDCRATYARYTKRYAARVKATTERRYSSHRHRQTSLAEAALDLFMCANAAHFMGSSGSSFSDAIMHLRACNGRASPEDRHTFIIDDWTWPLSALAGQRCGE